MAHFAWGQQVMKVMSRKNQLTMVTLPRFFISRYPVTNAQYRCFIEAGMYEDQAFWHERLPEAAACGWTGRNGR